MAENCCHLHTQRLPGAYAAASASCSLQFLVHNTFVYTCYFVLDTCLFVSFIAELFTNRATFHSKEAEEKLVGDLN